MYQSFFGFREKPFNLTPDPKFLYLNASYREALAALHYGVNERKGFVSLIGEAGTGKTTLLRRLLSELPRETRSVLVINPAIGFEDMLRFILTDLGHPPAAGANKLDMLEALNVELLDTLARGGNVVVLIDEAQDLTIPVLEELRLLSNLETAKEKILQLVIAGQPELDDLLARREIRQLRQRISVRARLRPLARSEVQAYVGARIAAAGGDVRGLFTPGALYRLWRFSGGVPRLINAACDNALITAYAAGRRQIRWRDVGEAMRDLRRQVSWAPSRLARGASLLTAAAVGGVIVLGGLWLMRERPAFLARTVPPSDAVGAGPAVAPPVQVAAALATATIVAPTVAPTPIATSAPAVVGSPDVVPSGAPVAAADEPVATATELATPEPTATPTPEPPTPTPTQTEMPTATATPSRRHARSSDLKVRITSGDTLTDLASHYYGGAGSRVLETIREANPWLSDPDVIWVGKMLILPAPRVTDDPPERGNAPTIDTDLPASDVPDAEDDPFSDKAPDERLPPAMDDDTSTP